jgi:adhesin transport system outer membrane protein
MKTKVILSLLIGLNTINISADTLKNVVSSVLDTNPIVNERFKNYEATKAEIGIAEAGYYPTVDLKSSSGRKTTGKIDTDILSETYNVFQNSLILRQNVFSGFSTNEKVNYQKMRTLSASYSYLSKANDVALQVVNVYIDLQKEKALLANSNLNVKHNEITYKKVKNAHKAGLSTFSEVSKIHSSLSLAKSNVIFQNNKLINANHRFKRVVGTTINPKMLQKIPTVLQIPDTQNQAEVYAMEYSPAIMASLYNIKGAKALHNESKSAFYPKVDLEFSQNYNENYNEFIGTDDRSQGLVVLSYNLYNGGADEAKRVKTLHKLNQEVAITDDLKRDVTLNVQLAWGSYKLAQDQIPFLEQYKSQSKETLKLYSSEYQLGKRSLLDLISAENDLKRANDELIYAKYGLLQAKYSIMHAMGLIMVAIMGSEEEYYQRVGVTHRTKNTHVKEEMSHESLQTAMQAETSSQVNTQHRVPNNVERDTHTVPTTSKPTKQASDESFLNLGGEIDSVTKVRSKSR